MNSLLIAFIFKTPELNFPPGEAITELLIEPTIYNNTDILNNVLKNYPDRTHLVCPLENKKHTRRLFLPTY